MISVDALKAFVGTAGSKAVKLTKDHHYPRKVAAAELFSLKWTTIDDPAQEVLRRIWAVMDSSISFCRKRTSGW